MSRTPRDPAMRSPRARWYRRGDAHPAPLHDRRHRPVALRSRRGRPRPDAHHARHRQAQGDRQGGPPADVAPRRQPRAVRRADRGARAWPDVRRRHPGQRRARLAQPARFARARGDRLVPRRAGRPLARGAPRRRAAVHAPAPRLRAARRRDGARAASRAGTRCTCSTSSASGPRWTAASSATGCSRPTSASAGSRRSAASCASAVPDRRTTGRDSRSTRSSCSRPTSVSTSRRSRRSGCRPRSSARRGGAARLRARRARARRSLAGLPRRGPRAALNRTVRASNPLIDPRYLDSSIERNISESVASLRIVLSGSTKGRGV